MRVWPSNSPSATSLVVAAIRVVLRATAAAAGDVGGGCDDIDDR